jgi:hypothetical protein
LYGEIHGKEPLTDGRSNTMSKRKNVGWSKRIDSKLDKAWAVIRKLEAYNTRRAASMAMINAHENKIRRDNPALEDIMF